MSIRSCFTLFVTMSMASMVAGQEPVERDSASVNVVPAVIFSEASRKDSAVIDAVEVLDSEVKPAANQTESGKPSHIRRGTGILPNEHGQIWREYDIRSYTSRIKEHNRPEQAIVDWILRETGTEIWFSEPLGILSANRNTVRVYHVPQIHEMVAAVVDRFLSSETESHAFSMRLVTLGSPNWRSSALQAMVPVTVQTPGTEAWLMSKEEAAVLLNNLRRRNDFREHGTPDLLIHNGQKEVIEQRRPRQYVRSVLYRKNSWPGYELDVRQIHEGFSLQLIPLMSQDGQTVDAVIKAHVDQIEKMEDVAVDVPAIANKKQRVQIQIPCLSGWQLHERFRWPADKVLIISRGVVATPVAAKRKFLVKTPMLASRSRGDALLFLECKGPVGERVGGRGSGVRLGASHYRGRY